MGRLGMNEGGREWGPAVGGGWSCPVAMGGQAGRCLHSRPASRPVGMCVSGRFHWTAHSPTAVATTHSPTAIMTTHSPTTVTRTQLPLLRPLSHPPPSVPLALHDVFNHTST